MILVQKSCESGNIAPSLEINQLMQNQLNQLSSPVLSSPIMINHRKRVNCGTNNRLLVLKNYIINWK